MDKFSLIDVGSFVAIRAEKYELFHLMQVVEKHIAETKIADSSGTHSILIGEPYLVCKWYSFLKEGKKLVSFTPQSEKSEKSLVHMGEIVTTQLTLNEKNQMDINDYRMLLCKVSY